MKQKLHFFRMLLSFVFLWTIGVTQGWAGEVSYTIQYSGVPSDQTGGYTVINRTVSNNTTITSDDNATTLVTYRANGTPTALNSDNISNYIQPKGINGYSSTITYNQTNKTFTIKYSVSHALYHKIQFSGAPSGAGFSLINITLGHTTTFTKSGNIVTASNTGSLAAARITTQNFNDVIQLSGVNGYVVKPVASGGNGTSDDPYIITVYCYDQSKYKNWVIDGLEYSTFYVKSTGEQYLLPDGEVAVSLYLGGPVTGGIYGETTWQEETITDIIAYFGALNRKGDAMPISTGASNALTKSDDDGDAAGTQATYEFLGQLAKVVKPTDGSSANLGFNDDYFYKRTHQVYVSTLTDVVIPATVPSVNASGQKQNDSYRVTAIQKFGFTYSATDQTDHTYCLNGKEYILKQNINDHRNDYLKSVTFEQPCQISSIGDYAFISCENLESFTVPYTVEYLGTGTFESNRKLETVSFQTNPNTGDSDFGKTRLRTIENWTFWDCTGLKSVTLADGITHIEGQASGSPFQYNLSLTYIRLPNTLEYIGPHFLCTAKSIKTVTIPASVGYIDGACFHGCESLESVYLLGQAAYLVADGGGGSKTFGENAAFCGDHVHRCTFYVPESYLPEYQRNEVWSLIDEQGLSDGVTYTNAQGRSVTREYGNTLGVMPSVDRTFAADTWQTVIFPQRFGENSQGAGIGVRNYKSVFGNNTLVAELTSVESDPRDPHYKYNLTFTLISGENIPSGKPLLIKPEQQTTFTMFSGADQAYSAFLLDMTDEHSYYVEADDGTLIFMKGCYIPETKLAKWDFYFAKVDGKYVFRKVPDNNSNFVSGATKCWWKIERGGVSVDGEAGNAKMTLFDDILTDINDVPQVQFVIKGVYDVNGRKVSDVELDENSLQRGIYIVNGKKVMIK